VLDGLTQAELLQLFIDAQKDHPGLTLEQFMEMAEKGEITPRKEHAS
jgi:hypothetical protein